MELQTDVFMSKPRKKTENITRYKADITAGALKIFESRMIADLLIKQLSKREWENAILNENVLQARSLETAKRLSRLLKARLETWDVELWKMVRDGDAELATQACLASAIKHSNLLADFFNTVLKGHYRAFNEKLTDKDWDGFVSDCYARDPDLPSWSNETIRRLKSTIFQILAQAGYLESTRSLKLQPVHIVEQLERYLSKKGEDQVLLCMKVGR